MKHNARQNPSEAQKRFQTLLRELFQFDSADLDFGIYRIMNHKRAVIERFHHRRPAPGHHGRN
jgi:hypothetical protein